MFMLLSRLYFVAILAVNKISNNVQDIPSAYAITILPNTFLSAYDAVILLKSAVMPIILENSTPPVPSI